MSNSTYPEGYRIKETVKKTINLTLPIFSSLRLQIEEVCAGMIFWCHFKSFKVLSAGRNVDGFMSDILNGRIKANFFKKNPSSSRPPNIFHNNGVNIDLGVITNTGNIKKCKKKKICNKHK